MNILVIQKPTKSWFAKSAIYAPLAGLLLSLILLPSGLPWQISLVAALSLVFIGVRATPDWRAQGALAYLRACGRHFPKDVPLTLISLLVVGYYLGNVMTWYLYHGDIGIAVTGFPIIALASLLAYLNFRPAKALLPS